MSGRYLLDTNIVIALFADEVKVKSKLAEVDEAFIPCIAVGELCYGAQKSGRPQENLARIGQLVANVTVLDCDINTAKRYGEIKNKLHQKGNPLPENDIWIAAIALQHNLTVVTRDAHFRAVEHLTITVW